MATYQGSAKITAVDGSELREFQKEGLTDDQIENSMLVIITVQPDDKSFGECNVEVEISDRECKGKMAGKIQRDISLDQLFKQKLISAASLEALEEMFPAVDEKGNKINDGCIGKKVNVYQKESTKGEGADAKKYVNTYLSSSLHLGAKEIGNRIARMRGLKPTAAANPNANPFD